MRRMGELLGPGGVEREQRGGDRRSKSKPSILKLSDLEISRDTSSLAQRIIPVPERSLRYPFFPPFLSWGGRINFPHFGGGFFRIVFLGPSSLILPVPFPRLLLHEDAKGYGLGPGQIFTNCILISFSFDEG